MESSDAGSRAARLGSALDHARSHGQQQAICAATTDAADGRILHRAVHAARWRPRMPPCAAASTIFKDPPSAEQYLLIAYVTMPMMLGLVVLFGLHRQFERPFRPWRVLWDQLKLHGTGLYRHRRAGVPDADSPQPQRGWTFLRVHLYADADLEVPAELLATPEPRDRTGPGAPAADQQRPVAGVADRCLGSRRAARAGIRRHSCMRRREPPG